MGLKRRILCAFALSVIIASPLGIPTAAHAQQSATLSTTSSSSRIRIDNFGRIDQRYFRGAQPMGHDYSDLAALGVKTVINLTSDDAQANERAMVEGAGMAYLHIPMTTHEPPTSAQLAQFLTGQRPGPSTGIRALRRRQAPHGSHDGGLPDHGPSVDGRTDLQGNEAVQVWG